MVTRQLPHFHRPIPNSNRQTQHIFRFQGCLLGNPFTGRGHATDAAKFALLRLILHRTRNTHSSHSHEAESTDNFIGLARCVTDFTTFVYLTDVYIDPAYQGKGLGTWLMECVQEVIESMPNLRRSMLLAGDWKRAVPFYERILGMELLENKKGEDGSGQGLAVLMRKGRGNRDP
jgi:GNAT superfamily N-acetyltransferase